jgi:hypothetical protein
VDSGSLPTVGANRLSEPRPVAQPARRQSRWWFVCTAAVTALVGLALNRRAGTELEPTDAADVRSVLSALSAFAVLSLGFQLVLAGTFSSSATPGAVRRPASWSTIAGLAVASGAVAGVAVVIGVDAPVGFELQLAVGCGLAVAAMVAAVPSRAILLGAERWRDLGLIGLVAMVPRLGVTLLSIDESSLWSILAAVVAAEIVATTLLITATHRTERVHPWPHGALRHLVNGMSGSIGLGLLLVLISTTSRSHLGDEADRYSESASVSRTVFILLFTVAFVFFPAMATSPLGTIRLRRAFHEALALSCTTAFVAVAIVMAFPETVASFITNDDVSSPSTVRMLAVAFAANGIAVISLMQYISHGSRMALLTWPLAVPMAIAQLTATTATSLAGIALLSSGVLLVAVSLPALMRAQPMLRPVLIDPATPHPPTHIVDVGTTVVVPSYNPGPVVLETVHRVLTAFDEADLAVEVVVVTDGSTDSSGDLLDTIADHRVRHIRHATNRGKGAALRTGFALARTPVIGFVDADGDLPPTQLVEMVRVRAERDADIVFGSKRHGDSRIDISIIRRVTSRAYQILIRTLFQLDINDTQTGIKVFSSPTIRDVLPVVKEDGFALDLELFVAARATGHDRFVELPIELVRAGSSTISSRSVVTMFGHTLRIFWRGKVALQYLRAAAAEPARAPSMVGGAE